MKKFPRFKNRKIDRVGSWDGESPTILDNTAYQLYCNSIIEYNKDCELFADKLIMRQWHFINEEGDEFEEFYNDAKVILRNKKIKNVSKRIQTKGNRFIKRRKL